MLLTFYISFNLLKLPGKTKQKLTEEEVLDLDFFFSFVIAYTRKAQLKEKLSYCKCSCTVF